MHATYVHAWGVAMVQTTEIPNENKIFMHFKVDLFLRVPASILPIIKAFISVIKRKFHRSSE